MKQVRLEKILTDSNNLEPGDYILVGKLNSTINYIPCVYFKYDKDKKELVTANSSVSFADLNKYPDRIEGVGIKYNLDEIISIHKLTKENIRKVYSKRISSGKGFLILRDLKPVIRKYVGITFSGRRSF